jgi:hypothetical protein
MVSSSPVETVAGLMRELSWSRSMARLPAPSRTLRKMSHLPGARFSTQPTATI